MRVALVHDYLNQRGGAERVFSTIAAAWPQAPVFTSLYDPRELGDLVPPQRVHTSYLAQLPGANRYFRALAPLYPRAFEAFDLSGYDAIVSSTTAWAKGVCVPPGAVHVCYINTVSRFAFAYDEYVGGLQRGGSARWTARIARPIVERLIAWDRAAATRPTRFVANSHNVAKRIARYYGREADVLPCPVELSRFSIGSGAGDYYFIASRLLPYKRLDRAIEAAQLAGVRLLIAGTGPAQAHLRERARGTTTTLLGYVSDREMNELLGSARAAILPGEEDFGLLPLEAAACGRPTIALRAGGALETIVEAQAAGGIGPSGSVVDAGPTGVFFDEPSAQSLAEVLRTFDPSTFDPQRLRAHAERFSPQRFTDRLRAIVARVYAERT